jgi:hypothetical protein
VSIDRRLTRLAQDRRLFRPVAEVAVPPVPLKTAADVLAVLAEQVGAVRADPEAGGLEKPASSAPSRPLPCGPWRPATWRSASNCWRRS